MNPSRMLLLGASALTLASCADFLLPDAEASRYAAEVEIVAGQTVLTAGESTNLSLRVIDQHGRPFAALPPWAAPVWRAANTSVLRVGDARVEAQAPGETSVLVELADRVASLQMRVNPVAVRLTMHAYVVQNIQNWEGALPLVAGRDAVVRVFVTADQVNFFEPGVRVRFFRGGQEVASLVSPPRFGIPLQVSEGMLANSYNLVVPGSVLKPGTTYTVETLTDGVVPLLGGSVTRLPAAGDGAPLNIVEAPTFRIRFVPVIQPGGPVANVTTGNVEQFMGATRAVFPLGEVHVDVRQPYTSTASTATESGWSQLINEVRVLRLLDGQTQYYYHGIVRRIAHWAGLGYVGHPVALSYDALPAANWVVAHELGHNWGRRHAPCGNPSGIDTVFPHAGGGIGVYGLDLAQGQVVGPSTADLMGYCAPRWISDYTYQAVTTFRSRETDRFGVRPETAGGPGILIWGRISADGRVTLEPPIPVAEALEPPGPGPYRLEGRSATGVILVSTAFAADALSEGMEGERHFAFTVPMAEERTRELALLRLSGAGVLAELAPRPAATPGARTPSIPLRAEALGGERVAFTWDADQHPLVVVRDGRTGEVLSLARGGRVEIVSTSPELDLELSDGLGTQRQRIAVAPGRNP